MLHEQTYPKLLEIAKSKSVDIAIEASGFTPSMAKEFEDLVREQNAAGAEDFAGSDDDGDDADGDDRHGVDAGGTWDWRCRARRVRGRDCSVVPSRV